MEYHILHDFRTLTPFMEKSSDRSLDLHNLKLLTNFVVNQTSVLGGVINYLLNVRLIQNSSW